MKQAMLILTAVVLLAGLAGCNKFNRENYDTIYMGQPIEQVEMTLGKPHAAFSSEWVYINDEPFYKAIIKFQDGKVTGKSWFDERRFGMPGNGEMQTK